MIPSPWKLLNLFLLLVSSAATATASAAIAENSQSLPTLSSNGTTVFELLTKFGLPPGLLPNTVTSFSLTDNGDFEVNLSGKCYVNFEYLVYYESKITGVVRYGEISDLKGIQVRRFLVWFNVESIKVDLPLSKYIYFDVGWITKKLSIEQFTTVHSCQKGLTENMIEQVVDLYLIRLNF
ncbi:hypothetical protein KSP40_PGU001093 [Platanthera guangdongensis]|uniref:Uncharacterized protein n=1 Tax=Platanthera guangdongensis TaxID=2320717 RepID=A0ABR2MXE1_9ASPA